MPHVKQKPDAQLGIKTSRVGTAAIDKHALTDHGTDGVIPTSQPPPSARAAKAAQPIADDATTDGDHDFERPPESLGTIGDLLRNATPKSSPGRRMSPPPPDVQEEIARNGRPTSTPPADYDPLALHDNGESSGYSNAWLPPILELPS